MNRGCAEAVLQTNSFLRRHGVNAASSALSCRSNLLFFQTTRSDFDSSEFEVRRRYQDFLWLRSKLEESHPTLIVHVCMTLCRLKPREEECVCEGIWVEMEGLRPARFKMWCLCGCSLSRRSLWWKAWWSASTTTSSRPGEKLCSAFSAGSRSIPSCPTASTSKSSSQHRWAVSASLQSVGSVLFTWKSLQF